MLITWFQFKIEKNPRSRRVAWMILFFIAVRIIHPSSFCKQGPSWSNKLHTSNKPTEPNHRNWKPFQGAPKRNTVNQNVYYIRKESKCRHKNMASVVYVILIWRSYFNHTTLWKIKLQLSKPFSRPQKMTAIKRHADWSIITYVTAITRNSTATNSSSPAELRRAEMAKTSLQAREFLW